MEAHPHGEFARKIVSQLENQLLTAQKVWRSLTGSLDYDLGQLPMRLFLKQDEGRVWQFSANL